MGAAYITGILFDIDQLYFFSAVFPLLFWAANTPVVVIEIVATIAIAANIALEIESSKSRYMRLTAQWITGRAGQEHLGTHQTTYF